MADYTIEDTVILWDCSRSMVRNDLKPSRMRIAQKCIKIFIEKKFQIDAKDTISIVIYGARTKKISDFSNDKEALFKSMDNFEFLGSSNLEDAIAFSLQMLVKQIQKLGGKVPRIFIVTDNNNVQPSERLTKLVKVAQGLGVFIDTCQMGGAPKEDKPNALKEISSGTNSEYAYFNNFKALYRAAEGFASKKIINETEDYFDPNKDKNKLPSLISDVAVDLRRPNIGEIRDMMHGKTDNKCQICYQNQCSTCHSPFYACGRFCPSCGRPLHLHCASMWAQRSEFPEKNVFRCPFCYFLLRVPKSVLKFMEATGGQSIKIVNENDISGQTIKMIRVPDDKIQGIDDSCSFCNNIFTGEEKVFQCSNCKTYYHENCLKKMYDEMKACRHCGGSIG
jgi:uncharacterized protein YegL